MAQQSAQFQQAPPPKRGREEKRRARRREERAVRLGADSRRQGRVYQALGLSGGAFLVILLL